MKCILKVGKNEYDYNNGVLLIDNGFKYIGEDISPEFKTEEVSFITQTPMSNKYEDTESYQLHEGYMYFQPFGVNYYSKENKFRDFDLFSSHNVMNLCRLKNMIELGFCAMDIVPDYVEIIKNSNDEIEQITVDAYKAYAELSKIIAEENKEWKQCAIWKTNID